MDMVILTHFGAALVGAVFAAGATVHVWRRAWNERVTELQREAHRTQEGLSNAVRELSARTQGTDELTRTAIRLGPLVTLRGENPPQDPVECLTRAEQVLRLQTAAVLATRRRGEQLNDELERTRRELTEVQTRFQAFREQTEQRLDDLAHGTAPPPGTTDPYTAQEEERQRRKAAQLQLSSARRELEDLRTKLRFANKTILQLESKLKEAGNEPEVPDMLLGLPPLGRDR